MVLRLLAIFILIMIAIPPDARAYDPEFSKIISYSKLMALPPAKRAEYIQTVRYIQMEFEALQKDVSGVSSQDVADATAERNFFLDMLIQDAQAAPIASKWWSVYDPSKMYPCRTLTDHSASLRAHVQNDGAKLACMPTVFLSCPSGYLDTHANWQGRKFCFKPGFNKAARDAAQKRQQAQAQQAQAQAKAKAASDARQVKALADARKAEERRRIANREKRHREVRARIARAKNSQEQIEASADGATDDQQDNEPGIQADEDTFHKVLKLPDYTIARDGDNNPAQLWTITKDRHELEDKTCADQPDINPPADTCNEQTVKAAKRAFYRDGAPHCLYAGNLSHYANREKRPGNCQKPREFCLTRITCRDENNALKTNENIIIKCEDQSQVLCNPYIFNLDENDKALCVTPGPNATSQCNDRADEVKQKVGADHYFPFVTRVKLNNVSDTRSTEALRGIQEGWDNFADEMNKICFESPSKDLYCRECAIMKRRVADLNLATLSSKAPDANGNCYYFRHLNTHLKGDQNGGRSGNSSGRNAETSGD